jgi:heptosyltransferase-1
MTFRAPNTGHQAPTGLLVIRLSALGDVIHTVPAVAMLRDALPGVPIEWAVESPYRELVEIVARVGVIPASLKRWSRSPIASRREIFSFRRAIRSHSTAIDFQGLIKSAVVARASGAKLRYGFNRQAIREKPALLFINRPVPVDRAKHVVDWNIALARAVTPHAAVPPVDFSCFASDPSGKFSGSDGAVVLMPGAGRPEKLWPIDRFREVASRFAERTLVVWGPGEKEMAEAIGAPMAPATNLRELAYALSRAAVVIAADTGPLHLADALGTKVVGLYGPTNPRRNGPYHQLQRCVSAFETSQRMDSITPQAVISMIERTLAQ